MKPAMPATSGAPYTVPPEPNRVSAILLALAVHAALLAFLWIGISWQNTEPPAVEAEVWDMKIQSAAPPPPPPPPSQEVAEPTPEDIEKAMDRLVKANVSYEPKEGAAEEGDRREQRPEEDLPPRQPPPVNRPRQPVEHKNSSQ